MSAPLLRVMLLWHMHQPEYRDPLSGAFVAPWTYLHALKDYSDMAAHLEAHPGACATFNFTPLLLDQIETYVRRLAGPAGDPLGDELLEALRQPVIQMDQEHGRALMRQCLRAHRTHMVERFPVLAQLTRLAEHVLQDEEALDYVGEGFLADLLVWYHLAWLGESVRRDDQRIQSLMAKGRFFTAHDRALLLQVISETLGDLLARYRRLQDAGRIELCSSPLSHPILPLMLDFGSAREAQPELCLPATSGYPGGVDRVREQLSEARTSHGLRFGTPPAGCWPSEGALSTDSLQMIGEAGFGWAASSQSVLRRSLGAGHLGSDQYHRPYRLGGRGPVVFFRDDALSDLIGFSYKDWPAEDAVSDLLGRLEAIASDAGAGPGRVVLIALDGENAWEHYPGNGAAFLAALYRRLGGRSDILLTTPSHVLQEAVVPIRQIGQLVAGSWVYGDLSTWIGHPDKNRAWDMLVEAKRACDAASPLSPEARRQLAVCEGSDWFWWPGDYNPQPLVQTFEGLFRRHLAALYRLLCKDPPDYLALSFSHGGSRGNEFAVLRPQRS